jgi:hypothetical protein
MFSIHDDLYHCGPEVYFHLLLINSSLLSFSSFHFLFHDIGAEVVQVVIAWFYLLFTQNCEVPLLLLHLTFTFTSSTFSWDKTYIQLYTGSAGVCNEAGPSSSHCNCSSLSSLLLPQSLTLTLSLSSHSHSGHRATHIVARGLSAVAAALSLSHCNCSSLHSLPLSIYSSLTLFTLHSLLIRRQKRHRRREALSGRCSNS